MDNRGQCVEIKQAENGSIELRYFEQPNANGYLGWKMPLDRANDLAQWWKKEEAQIVNGQLPIIDHKLGNVLISMFTQTRVEVRELDLCGRPKMQGYALPRVVVEYLVTWLQETR